jgi:hypothetical protein
MSRDLSELTWDTRVAVARLFSFAASKGLTVRLDSAKRSCDEQRALFAQGREGGGNVVTNAQGCGSYHVLGRAVDIYVGSWNCKDYEELGKYWESIGGRWGGRFALMDCVHFEWPHPFFDLKTLCPQGLSCEAAIALQPPALSGTVLMVLGAVVGGSLALVLRRA